jgi:hypothetical protein
MATVRLGRLRAVRGRGFSTYPALNALSSFVRPKAEQISRDWQGTSATGGTTKNFIGGEFVESEAEEWHDVVDPVRTSCSYRLVTRLNIEVPHVSSQRKRFFLVSPRQQMPSLIRLSEPHQRLSRHGAGPPY